MEDKQLDSSPPSAADAAEMSSRARLAPVVVTICVTGFTVLATAFLAQQPWFPQLSSSAARQALDTLFTQAASPPRAPTTRVTAALTARSGPETAAAPVVVSHVSSGDLDRAPAPADGRGVFGIGDRIKVNFYERIEVEEDKWGRGGSALKTLQSRPELSGEFSVQEDGTIAVPLLGSIPVTERSAAQVQAALGRAFQDLVGRQGIVSIAASERQPIYVIGPVKNPGSYKYAPNMTVLHAVALSGGLDHGAGDPWQKIEAVRAIQRRSGAADSMIKLLARSAVLKGERDGTRASPPLKLVELVGMAEANALLMEQADKRKAISIARRNRELSINSALDSARQDVKLVANRMGPLDDLIKLRQDRVRAVTSLVDKSVLAKSVLNQVQTDLAEADQRRTDTLGQYTQVKQRLQSLEAESTRLISDLRSELDSEIEMTDRQITEQEREYTINEGVLSTLPATRAQFAASRETGRNVYRVVRQTPNGPGELKASGMTVLQPGDLVNIMPASEANEAGEPPSPAPMPTRALSTEPGVGSAKESRAKQRLTAAAEHGPLGSNPRIASELK
ncbi:hypothetical protein GU700_01100 [Methylobacterium sp. NI91]|nr:MULTISPECIES: polysaccharide biosynthesis/export family protein [unclassified Methylobacterium]QIJ73317.1 hypothetical protein CLZ_01100 [Methylobacterium sp. CLZ]QIJ78221.1 hypothetical protein GU700_01100 [Methylobacterium sp. NI91]